MAEDDEPSNFLAKSIGISNPNVIDMSPAKFWKMYLDHFEDISRPPKLVVAIMGDLIRDRSDEKSLPWYKSLVYLLIVVLTSPL
jgi:hypothetical protein